MTITSDRSQTNAANRPMTLQEYLDYDDGTDARYELVDGVLTEMGAETDLNVLIAMVLIVELAKFVPVRLLRRGTEIAVPRSSASSRYPDLVVLTEAGDAALPRQQRSLITFEMPAPALVVEVVSPGEPGSENYKRDYIDKRQEYAARGIPEYWIIDPNAALITICVLKDGQYQSTEFRGTDGMVSPTLPTLDLTAAQILQAG